MIRIITAAILASGITAVGLVAATADHEYGDWQPVPPSMYGVTVDAIDNGSPTFVVGEHAMYVDKNGTRYVITMPGRIGSS